MTLLASVNHQGSQEDVISNCSQFGERCGLWVWDCSGPLPSTSGYCTPASLPLGREGPKWQPASSPLVFDRSQDFVLWTHQGSPTGVRAFCGRGPSIYFFVSLATPQFGLLCHISTLRFSSGHSSPVPTMRTNDAAHACLSSPHLLLGVATVRAAHLLVVAVGCVLCCFFLFPSYVALWDSKAPHRLPCWRVSYCAETSPSRHPPWGGSPSLNPLSLFFFFFFFLLLKRLDCLSGCLVSSANVQKLFCGSCSAFKWLFDELVGEKVVSLKEAMSIT